MITVPVQGTESLIRPHGVIVAEAARAPEAQRRAAGFYPEGPGSTPGGSMASNPCPACALTFRTASNPDGHSPLREEQAMLDRIAYLEEQLVKVRVIADVALELRQEKPQDSRVDWGIVNELLRLAEEIRAN